MTSSQRWTLIATVIGSGTVFLDGTMVNVALPRIGRDLPHSVLGVLEGQTYIVSGYLAVLAALLILAGALSDYFGRRRIYAIGLAAFGTTSAMCGLAPTLETMVIARLLQGAAGALLVPGSLAIISQAFQGEARGRAFGVWASATSALTILGPIVGGITVDSIGWRFAFLANVPLAMVGLWATLSHVTESRDETAHGRFDWLGALVAALAVGGLAFGLIRGQEAEWRDPVAWLALVVGLTSIVLFPILMARRSNPLVPLELFRSRVFATLNLATFFVYGALYVMFSYQSLILQNVLGYTALGAGMVGLPSGLLLVLLSTRVGSNVARLGARRFLVVGPLLMAAALVWYTRLPYQSAPWQVAVDAPDTYLPPLSTVVDVLPAVVLFGLGIAQVVAPLTTTLMGSVPAHNTGIASAINNAISRVGQPLLGAIMFIVISATFYGALGSRVAGLDAASPDVRRMFPPLNPPVAGATIDQIRQAGASSIDAFHLAMLVGAGLLVVGAAISWVGLRPSGDPDASPHPQVEPVSPA